MSMVIRLRLATLGALLALLAWVTPVWADVSGTCRINSAMVAGCGGHVCSVYLTGDCQSPNCPFVGYHWDQQVAILYYDVNTGQWSFCGVAIIPSIVMGCTFPCSGQTATMFAKGHSYLFRFVATIDHNDGTPAAICISSPFSYTVPGS